MANMLVEQGIKLLNDSEVEEFQSLEDAKFDF